MRKLRLIVSTVFAAGALIALTSCAETTGNPREGGLFGWSESKAQDRLDQRQYEANRINADTNQIYSENRKLRRQLR